MNYTNTKHPQKKSRHLLLTTSALLIFFIAIMILTNLGSAVVHGQTTSPLQPEQYLRVSSVLQNHMVVQQNKPFKVWGHGPVGASISIKADWMQSAI